MTAAPGIRSRRGLRRVLGLLAATALSVGPVVLPAVLPALAPGAAGAAAAPVLAEAAPGVHVELEQLGPTALVPGGELEVRVRVTNLTGAPVTGARARLFVNSPVLADRASVAAWAAGEGVQGGDRFSGVAGAEQPLDTSLAPGASREVGFTVEADALRLGGEFGPRGVTVDVLDASLQRLDALRTFLVWMPQHSPPATAGLTVLAPVVAGAPDVVTAQLPESVVEEQVGPQGRLSRLLTATASSPSTTLVVDPAVLGPFARSSRPTPSPAPTTAPAPGSETASGAPQTSAATAPPSPVDAAAAAGGTGDAPELVPGQDSDASAAVTSWLLQLDGRTPGGLVVLPQGDVDVLSAAAAGAEQLLPLALAQSSATTVDRTGGAPAARLVWPVDATPAAPVVLAAASAAPPEDAPDGAPGDLVVLDTAAVPEAVGARGTAPAVVTTTATAPDGSLRGERAVLVDAVDSALLATATDVTGPAADDASGTGGAAGAAARLLADTAVTASAGAPADDLVLAVPRDWDPDPSAATAVLSPLGAAPWVRSAPLTDLLGQEPTQVVPVDGQLAPTTATTTAGALPAEGLLRAQAAVDATTSVSRLVEPDGRRALLEPVERSAVAAASLGWRSRQESWSAQVAELSSRAEQYGQAVAVVSGSPVLAIDSQFQLPVTVRNSLPQAVTVLVSVRSTSYRLVAGEPQSVTIPAGAQEPVSLPVRAVASGDTTVAVVLTDLDGSPVGEQAPLRVRVRADWEGRGVAAVAVLAVLVLVGGIVRTVVRVRRRAQPPVVRSPEAADDTDSTDSTDDTDGARRPDPTRRPEESSRG